MKNSCTTCQFNKGCPIIKVFNEAQRELCLEEDLGVTAGKVLL